MPRRTSSVRNLRRPWAPREHSPERTKKKKGFAAPPCAVTLAKCRRYRGTLSCTVRASGGEAQSRWSDTGVVLSLVSEGGKKIRISFFCYERAVPGPRCYGPRGHAELLTAGIFASRARGSVSIAKYFLFCPQVKLNNINLPPVLSDGFRLLNRKRTPLSRHSPTLPDSRNFLPVFNF